MTDKTTLTSSTASCSGTKIFSKNTHINVNDNKNDLKESSSLQPIASNELVFINYGLTPRTSRVHMMRQKEDAIKYTMFIYNVLFTMKTVIQLGISVWLKTNSVQHAMLQHLSMFSPDMKPYNFECTILLTWLSVAALCIGFFSCRFSLVRYQQQLKLYVAAMSVVFIGELAVAILAMLSRMQISKLHHDHFTKSLSQETYWKNVEVRKTWDMIQLHLKCCGNEGPRDYFLLYPNTTVPTSCCKSHYHSIKPVDVRLCQRRAKALFNSSTDSSRSSIDDGLHKLGCMKEIKWHMKAVMGKVVGTSCGFSILQWIGMTIGGVLIITNMEFKRTV